MDVTVEYFLSVRAVLVSMDEWLITMQRLLGELEAGTIPPRTDCVSLLVATGHARRTVERTIAILDAGAQSEPGAVRH